MSDLVLFDQDEGKLLEARGAVAAWLQAERGLVLNRKRWEVCPGREPSVFLGYRVSGGGLSPGPKARRRLRQRLRAAARRGPQALARTLQTYRGILSF